ncbi:6728_t:CDS:2, partial [Dentiscutata heterogama]
KKPKSEIGNSDNSKDPELEVSNMKDPELENEKEPNTICYDQFEKPYRKLDGALAIPYDLNNIKNFGNIEEEILSRADHYDLKANRAITAFVARIKYKKNIQLCVYHKSNKANKRIHTLETEPDMINILDDVKKRIYENLPTCNIHVQGCLISEDG